MKISIKRLFTRRRVIAFASIIAIALGGVAIYSSLEIDWLVRDRITQIDSPDARVRYNAATNISIHLDGVSFLTRSMAESAVLKLLDDPNELVRGAATSGLQKKSLQPFVKRALPLLSKLCFSEEEQPRGFAARTIFVQGPLPPLADHSEINRMLQSTELEDRRNGMIEVLRYGDTATPFLMDVAEMTTDSDASIRNIAFMILDGCKPIDSEVVEVVRAKYAKLPENHPYVEELKRRYTPKPLKLP